MNFDPCCHRLSIHWFTINNYHLALKNSQPQSHACASHLLVSRQSWLQAERPFRPWKFRRFASSFVARKVLVSCRHAANCLILGRCCNSSLHQGEEELSGSKWFCGFVIQSLWAMPSSFSWENQMMRHFSKKKHQPQQRKKNMFWCYIQIAVAHPAYFCP